MSVLDRRTDAFYRAPRIAAVMLMFAPGALLLPALGLAQAGGDRAGSESKLAEIVVRAQRRPEPLQKVPIAVTVVSPSELQAIGVTDTSALSNAVPGLTISVNAESFLPHIRGVGTSAIGPGIENPVALYVDDVYYSSQVMSLTDLSDVSEVEVLKGPQGTLFGRNATGGVIMVTTRDPSPHFGGYVKTEVDNYLTSRTDAYVTGEVMKSLDANLFVGYTAQGNGWGKNLFTGKDAHRLDGDLTARSKWLFTPARGTAVKLELDYTSRRDSFGPNIRPAPGTVPALPGFIYTSNVYDTDTSLDNRNRSEFGGVSLRIDQSVGFANLVSISSYRHYHFRTQFDTSMGPTPLQYQFYTQDGRQVSQELRLESLPAPALSWVVGFYYFSAADRMPAEDQENSGVNAFPFQHQSIHETTDDSTDSKAVFAQATVRVLPATHLTGGIRYTRESRDEGGVIFGVFQMSPSMTIPINFPPISASHLWDSLTWRAALDHNFTPDVMGYVSYNRGFKSGGFNGFNPTNPAYNPESVDAYEAGFKSQLLDQRLRVNDAIFYNKYRNIQVETFGGLPTIVNGAGAKTYGDDLDVEAILGEGIRLTAGIEVLHATFTSYEGADTFRELPGGGVMLYEASATGHWLPYAPRFAGNLGLDYRRRLSVGVFDFNINDSHSSGYYGEPNNQLRQPAYDYLSTALTWTSQKSDLSVTFFARNLLDKRVATWLAGLNVRGFGADYSHPPLTFGGAVRYRF